MKAMYIKPSTEALQIGTFSMLQSVSGLGLGNGGTAGDNVRPQIPGRAIDF